MNTNQIKVITIAVWSTLSSVWGILYIPVLLMVACNIIDYATGLMAVPSREEGISSYRSMKGIFKKVSMWLLVVVGAIIDQLLKYASEMLGIVLPFSFLIACVVAIWIICNELISILENMIDIGVNIPDFLMPLVKHIRSQIDEAVENVSESGESVPESSVSVPESGESVPESGESVPESSVNVPESGKNVSAYQKKENN